MEVLIYFLLGAYKTEVRSLAEYLEIPIKIINKKAVLVCGRVRLPKKN
jgi:NH3-dependent NAD+ synthetase